MKRLMTYITLLILSISILPAWGETSLRIGILTLRDKEQTLVQFQPLVKYLETVLAKKIELKLYDFQGLNRLAAQNELDVILTAPAHYIKMKHLYGLSAPIVTQITSEGSQQLSAYGTVIFTRSETTNINTLSHISGKRIAISDRESFAGYQIPSIELLEAGLKLPEPDKLIVTGMPLDRVVKAVLDGRADVGCVRTGLLETMVREGKLNMASIKIINRQNLPTYPYILSTRLYPEWPVAVFPHIDEQFTRKLALALLSLPPDTVKGIYGFTIAADYEGVENLLRRLRIAPFDIAPDFTFSDLVNKHRYWFITLGFMGLLLTGALIAFIVQNRRVRQGKLQLEESNRQITANEEKLRSILEISPDIISIISEDGHLIYNSPAATIIHGYSPEEMAGINTFDLIHPDDQDQVSTAFHYVLNNPSEIVVVQYRYRNRDGRYIWMECSAKNQIATPHINGVIALSRNINDRKQAEEEKKTMEQQILQAQKLESLGVLAGGIAHDFNNILMAIMGNAELAAMKIRPESPALEHIHKIENSAARAADLAKQMLAYSGKGKFLVEQININSLLEEMLHLLEVSISKKALIRLNLYDNLPSVKADATQMRQIVMNLVINASEAIGDKSGVIAITTGCMDCDRSYLKDVWLNENLIDGLYVYLEIADTGCGMNKETLAKLFDPFFTTKFTGRGLGMSAVLGIIRGHHGAIKVYSEIGKGTTFKILLPASDKPAELFNGHNLNGSFHGSGTILLVDDEETVRGIGAEMLKEIGYNVITATDGKDALEKFGQNSDITGVILDLTMPRMDGEQCFRELRILKPDVKVIMSSGYSEQEVSEKFIGKGVTGFIQKPYKLSMLQNVMKKL